LREGNRRALGENLRQGQSVDDHVLIEALRVPTLIMWGIKDHVISNVPDAEQFHRDIVGSQVVTFKGAGHVLQEEIPDASVAALKAFLTGSVGAAEPDR